MCDSLDKVQVYTIPFTSYPKQSNQTMSKEETKFVDQEIQETLRKGLIYLTKKSGSIFKHFLVAKKMGKPSGT